MDIKTQRKMVSILRVLRSDESPMGSERIAHDLELAGAPLTERTIRNYLALADALGWTENLGRRGRRITSAGIREVERALVMDKVGFIAARVEELAYQMDFDPHTRKGKVILNITTFPLADVRAAFAAMDEVFRAGLGMGHLCALAFPGERLGGIQTPKGCCAIGTVCSVTINGLLLRARIAATSRFGGLLELEKRQPKRFVQIITYDGTTLDPLEIFIRGHMTSVAQTAQTGSGFVGASFREIPMSCLGEARRLISEADRVGLGGVLVVGNPGQPLLDVPVTQGRVGLIVFGGLNPIAAVVETGIAVTSTAMCALCDYPSLVDVAQLPNLFSAKGISVR
ncbi:MAG TPA: NrpR regulatory domain-containing protein [Candidatus Hydrogenedentes bacterium]|nr:NrpR regulatory domain-containing protein [Candidatus Hydrogenedentota bacterium]HOS02948.1 NrpR regulatory domain-containing protein [Candidatus Hydrogenedentota bacterium]